MIKKIFFILFFSFFVFLISLYFYYDKKKQFKKYISEVQKINSDIEINYLSGIKLKEEKSNKKIDKQKIIEEMIANNLANIDIVLKTYTNKNKDWQKVRYKKLYAFYMNKKNIDLAIKAVHKILEETDHKTIWYKKLIDLYMQIGKFDLAEEYAKKLLALDGTKENLKKYLYIKIQNINFFDESQVKSIKDLVLVLYKKKVISSDDLSFYNFLIDLLSKWNLSNLDKNIDILSKDLKNPEYKNLLRSIKSDYKTYERTKGTFLYYFKSLVALDLLRFGYFGLARNIAEKVYIQDNTYILPQQILAYSYFFMGNYTNAIKYLKLLKQNDISNQDDYNFFLGMSYYWIHKYEDALLYLAQLKNTYPYYEDVLRYKLISYIELKDRLKILDTIKELSKYKLSYVDYYNIFKYLLFECENCYKTQLHTIISLIRSCYKDVKKDNQYVCWYGKGNLFLKAGKKKLAVKYLKLLSNYFQDPYIYDNLANYYEEQGDKNQARIYYLKELVYTENEQKRKQLKEKIKKLLMDK